MTIYAAPFAKSLWKPPGILTQPFHPGTGPEPNHTGDDLGIPDKTPLLAVCGGHFVANLNWTAPGHPVGWCGELHGDDDRLLYRYGHMSRFDVPNGPVAAFQQLGASGGAYGEPGAGWSSGPHLHFEIDAPMGPVDPWAFLLHVFEGGDPDMADPHHIVAHLVAAHWDAGVDIVAVIAHAPKDANGRITDTTSPAYDGDGAHTDIVAHRLAAVMGPANYTLQDAENDIRRGHRPPAGG